MQVAKVAGPFKVDSRREEESLRRGKQAATGPFYDVYRNGI